MRLKTNRCEIKKRSLSRIINCICVHGVSRIYYCSKFYPTRLQLNSQQYGIRYVKSTDVCLSRQRAEKSFPNRGCTADDYSKR